MKKLSILLISFMFMPLLQAAIKTDAVEYKHGGTKLLGYVVYDDAVKEKRPGVLVVHEWWGLNDYAKKRGEDIAKLGYVAFVVDMYGKGVLTADFKEAARLSGIYKSDRNLMRARLQAARDAFVKTGHVDPAQVAVMGYCFGGGVALEAARSGADYKGAISFHGSLDTTMPAQPGMVKAKVIAFHGGDDKFVPMAAVNALEDEMRAAGADWQVLIFSSASHGFTNPGNGTVPEKGMAYNAAADTRSWNYLKIFLSEIFKS